MTAECCPHPFGTYVLAGGTVYRRAPARGSGVWIRRSVPPEAEPGRRCPVRVRYDDDQLPQHEVIAEDAADQVIRASVAGWVDKLRRASS